MVTSIVLVLLLLAGCAIPTPTPIPPTLTPTPPLMTVSVSSDGSGDYDSLAAAVRAVPEGSRIELGPDTHRLETPLRIGKAVTLVGVGMDETEVLSTGQGYGIRFVGPGPFVAQDITFRHEGPALADSVVVEGGEILFSRCRFAGDSGSHLSLLAKTTGLVAESVVEGGAGTVGVYIKEEARPTVEGITCSGLGYGIRVTGNAQPNLLSNTCQDNRYDGIKYDGQAAGEARQNELTGNRTGISIGGQAQPTLEENDLSFNRTSCLGYYEGAGGVARGNQCLDSFAGIGVSDNAQPTLEANECSNNQTAGIAYFVNAGGLARQNRCIANGVHGIGVFGSAAPVLEENVAKDNGSAGISFNDSSAGVARDNDCTDNAEGIHVAETASPSLEGNNCHDNADQDI
jgi:parallel beta-helix repeat protein